MKAFTFPEMYRAEDTYCWFIGKHAFIESAFKFINKKTPQILDIGCGTGGTTNFISKWGNVTGVEIDPIAASLAKKRGINVRIHSAQNLQFPNNHFDLVTIFDVLYHKGIEEHKVLSEAYRVLKKNGVILISEIGRAHV